MFATMSTSGLPNSALLHATPSPIGFEATLSVAMELESRLKAEMDGPDAKEQEGASDGSLNGETDQSSSLPPDMVLDEDEEDEEDGNGNSGSGGDHCHVCGYSVPSQFHLEMHMRTHGDHAIHSDGEGKGDTKDFQTDLESSDGFLANNQSPRVNAQGKVKTYRCKQCSFVALTKTDFWDHNKTHIKAEKLLTCPKCPFVTEYKHHLEYHLRNHFGSKPFKCSKCNYSCVNKSMLNSHMKSHSNIYQYRCSDCSYATKYCHSLKLHLRKYNHKPSTVLNPDGSPAVTPLIDVFGSRRGPRSKKGIEDVGPPLPYPPLQFPHLGPPYLYSSPILNGFRPFDNNGFPFVKLERSFMDANNGGRVSPILDEKELYASANDSLKCQMCEFSTSIKEHFNKHLLLHAAAENQDLCNLYGISSESLMLEQQQNSNANQPSALPALPAPPPPPSGQQLNAEEAKPTEDTGDTSRYQPVIVRRQEQPPRDTAIPLDLSSSKDTNHQHLEDSATKSRRKGKAFKLDRICLRLQGQSADEDSDTPPPVHHVIPGMRTAVAIPPSKRNMALLQPMPKLITIQGNGERTDTDTEQHPWKEAYECQYCDISFKDCIMYTMHMGYHGYKDPFKCNMCGQHTQDKVSFFLHIARSAHI